MDGLFPEAPHDAGVLEAVPGSDGIEGAHLLADAARQRLRRVGFTDRQIDAWAKAYVAEQHSGDLESFIAWIAREEQRHGSPAA
jgi:hypothetical protein